MHPDVLNSHATCDAININKYKTELAAVFFISLLLKNVLKSHNTSKYLTT